VNLIQIFHEKFTACFHLLPFSPGLDQMTYWSRYQIQTEVNDVKNVNHALIFKR